MKWACGLSAGFILLLLGCATGPTPKTEIVAAVPEAPPPPPPQRAQALSAPIIEPILSSDYFNPLKDKSVVFSFKVSKNGGYIVRIWDADGGLIRNLPVTAESGKAAEVSWDGKDDAGSFVPDEAYTFTVFSEFGGALYNPFAHSGGTRIDVDRVNWRREEQRIIYTLPYPCRMLVRAGTKPGPLLSNIVDWEPRKAGEVIEVWDGLDDSRAVYVPALPGFILTLSGFRLPDATILTHGNRITDFFNYRSQKPPSERLIFPPSDSPDRHQLYGQSLRFIRSPRLEVMVDGSVPKEIRLKDGEKAILHLALGSGLGPEFQHRRYEITLFIDQEPFFEEGQPFMPYALLLKAEYFRPGRHLVTINTGNFTNQYAEFSAIVMKE